MPGMPLHLAVPSRELIEVECRGAQPRARIEGITLWSLTMIVASSISFDLHVLSLCPRTAVGRTSAGPSVAAMTLGFSGADLSLSVARLLASAVRAAGGDALIVPSAYRAPVIPLMAARLIAPQHLDILRLQRGGTFGPLGEIVEEHAMWWRFFVDYRPALGSALDDEAELVCIDVDRGTGPHRGNARKTYHRWPSSRRGLC